MKAMLFIFLALVQGSTAFALEYTLVPLGKIPGGHSSMGYGINSLNEVVGQTSDYWKTYAFVWDEVSGMQTIPNPGIQSVDTRARDINDDGVIVGYFLNNLGNEEAFAYIPRLRRSINIGFLAGGQRSNALAINNRMQVVGWSESANGIEGFLWQRKSGMTGLGDLDGGNYESRARDINDKGVITGFGSVDYGAETFIYFPRGEGMQSLGEPAGGRVSGIGISINNANMIAGGGHTARCHDAAYWNFTTDIVALGDLPGGACYAVFFGINDANEMVGMSETDLGSEAIYWSASVGLVRLADLVLDGSAANYSIYEAKAINDAGYIVANAHDQAGVPEAVLLVPLP